LRVLSPRFLGIASSRTTVSTADSICERRAAWYTGAQVFAGLHARAAFILKETGMRSSWQRWVLIAALVVSANLFVSNPVAAAGKQTLTGEVGDAMCGAKHMPGEGTPAQCTRSCVAHGSKYALVVGDKIYVLETSDKAVLAVLDQQAGQKATVTGTVNGTSIEVSKADAVK